MIEQNVKMDCLQINGKDYFHIVGMVVYNANDDGVETDKILIQADDKLIKAYGFKDKLNNKRRRPRGELGVDILLLCENDSMLYVLNIEHCKGNIALNAYLDKQIPHVNNEIPYNVDVKTLL